MISIVKYFAYDVCISIITELNDQTDWCTIVDDLSIEDISIFTQINWTRNTMYFEKNENSAEQVRIQE